MLLFVEAFTKPAREDAAVLRAVADGYHVVCTNEHLTHTVVTMLPEGVEA